MQSRLTFTSQARLTTDYGNKFPLTSFREDARILWYNYDLWKVSIGQKLIQEILNDEKAARKAAADQAQTAPVAADDELDGFDGITDSTGY